MDRPRRSGPTPTDPGAGRRTGRPSLGYLAIALGIVAGGLAYWLMSSPTPTPVADDTATQATLPVAASSSAPAAPGRAATAASGLAPAVAQRVSRARDPDDDLAPDPSDYVNNGERPTMAEVIARLHQAGVYTGL